MPKETSHMSSNMPIEPSATTMAMPPGTTILVNNESEFVLVPTPTDDPNDPLNWPMTRKIVNIVLVYAVTIAVFAAIVMQTVFWPQMTVDLDMSFEELNAGLACNVAGLALGSALIIPFTMKYGRRPTYITSTAVMAAASWWSGRIQTLPEMYLTNLIYGLASSLNEVIAQLTIADLFFVHQRGKVGGFYIIATIFGNTLVPTLAGLQAEAHGWRWSYYTMGMVLTIMTIGFIFVFEETSYVPLYSGQAPSPPSTNSGEGNKAKCVALDLAGTADATPVESCPREPVVPLMNTYWQRMRFYSPVPSLSLLQCFISPWRMAMTVHVLYTALQTANLIAFLVLISSVNPIVLSAPPYNFGTAGVGLMLVGPFIGNVLGSIYGGTLGDWLVLWLAKRKNGIFEAEFRLYILPLPSLLVGLGLFVYGYTLDRGMHWFLPCFGSSLFMFGLGSILDMSFTIIIDTYKEATAESFVFITFMRNAIPLGLPFGIVPWMNAMSLTSIGIISGCVCTGISLLFIPMIIWGKKFRASSADRYQKVANLSSPME